MVFSTITFSMKIIQINGFIEIGQTLKAQYAKNAKQKSAGADKISQECLLIRKSVLAKPLTDLINRSIASGIVPGRRLLLLTE